MKYFFLGVIILYTSRVEASHLMGGEITWECITNGSDKGKLIFTTKIYCACYTGAAGCPTSTSITNPLYAAYGGVSSILCSRIAQIDLSPKCNDSLLEFRCFVPGKSAYSIEENVFVSQPVQINGVPEPYPTGSSFSWSACCRPPTVNISSQNGYYIKAKMYRYINPFTGVADTLGSSAGPRCYDSSPEFAERPGLMICSGNLYHYSHNAYDTELDSLVYDWGIPWISSSTAVTWQTGFSGTNQLPDQSFNSGNIPATLDKLSGEIIFRTLSPVGLYSSKVDVFAYKGGQPISQIEREVAISVIPCTSYANNPPRVDIKKCHSCPDYPYPAKDSAYAGDSFNLVINSTDIGFLPGGYPQKNSLRPTGFQFGYRFSDPNSGCNYPPCATLDTTNPAYYSPGNYWIDVFGVSTSFKWKTDCNHLPYVKDYFTKAASHTFVFKVQDNMCPVPAADSRTFTLTIKAPPPLPAPKIKCASIDGSIVNLSWDQPISASDDSLNSFRYYVIYRSINPAGPYDTIDSISNISGTQFTDNPVSLSTSPQYYFIQGLSSCNEQSQRIWSDTISPIWLKVTTISSGMEAALEWNAFGLNNVFPVTTIPKYYIWQIVGTDTLLVDSTSNLNDTIPNDFCYPQNAGYFIEVIDTTKTWGCVSRSNIASGIFGDNTPPSGIVIDSVSYNNNGSIDIAWSSSASDVSKFYIYRSNTLIDSVSDTIFFYNYIPTTSDPCLLEFRISANDTCGNMGSIGIPQDAICGKISNIVTCDTNKQVMLSWNLYNPSWSGGNGQQDILADTGTGWFIVATVSANDTFYIDKTMKSGVGYRYKIRSWNLGKTKSASSMFDSLFIDRFISGKVISSPDLRCVSYLSDSLIKIEWKRPDNSSLNFDSYHIYHSSTGNPGTFSLIDSLVGAQRSDNLAWDSVAYLHHTTKGGHRYRIVSRSGCDGLTYNDTMSRMVAAINPYSSKVNDVEALIEWNKVTANPLSNLPYTIHRDYPAPSMSFSPYKTRPFDQESLRDTLFLCDSTANYFITYPDGTGYCESKSSIVSVDYNDVTAPTKQFIDSVSVVNSLAILGWSPNPSSDVLGYYILKCLPSGYEMLDSVPFNFTSYTDNNSLPNEQVESYTAVAFDGCDNSLLAGENYNCHSTIRLRLKADPCNKGVNLLWNSYSTFASGFDVKYDVFQSKNGGPFEILIRQDQTSFKLDGMDESIEYCFFVRAIEKDGSGPISSSSNQACITTDFIDQPKSAYIQYVTVEGNYQTQICLNVDLTQHVDLYEVLRSPAQVNAFTKIQNLKLVSPHNPLDSILCILDTTASVERLSYDYLIQVYDICGELMKSTNIGRSILLQVDRDQKDLTHFLKWNEYVDWEKYDGVDKYLVMAHYGDGRFEIIEQVPSQGYGSIHGLSKIDNQFILEIDQLRLSKPASSICYQIIATPKNSGSNIEIISTSNTVCAVNDPLVYLPTSFTPNGDGLNDVYKAMGEFLDQSEFTMQIFNRWGERIFESTSIEDGWDGQYSGRESPIGMYLVFVTYTDSNGELKELQTAVTLVR